MIREIEAGQITAAVKELFVSANLRLPADAEALIAASEAHETCPLARSVFCSLRENLDAAKHLGIPICQDTGMAVLFCELGRDAHITGNFEDAVNEGVREAYTDGYLRKSVVRDPLFDRRNTGDNTPAVIHLRLVEGDRLTLTAAPKGFGSENMSAIKMLTPAATKDDVIAFVRDTVVKAGGNPCPPELIGVGIGGDFESCAEMSKWAIARPVSQRSPDPRYAALEAELLDAVNRTGVGAQGFGGDITAMAVNVEFAPTHIAGLPVAVNICCHVMRHAQTVI